MASKVCVFDNAINSRSPFIVHMRGVIFLAMTLPPGALNRADGVGAIATGRGRLILGLQTSAPSLGRCG
jgi:hypothetical protein